MNRYQSRNLLDKAKKKTYNMYEIQMKSNNFSIESEEPSLQKRI